jgi:hypothetical protein
VNGTLAPRSRKVADRTPWTGCGGGDLLAKADDTRALLLCARKREPRE